MWQLAIVAPNCEGRVSQMLTALAFDHHVFRVKRKVVLKGKITERLAPVFPGYVFVHARNAWITIREIIGVAGFVKFGDELANVAEGVVEDLIAACSEPGVLPWGEHEQEHKSRFAEGDHVLVKDLSCAAIFQHSRSDGKAIVQLEWMGRFVPAEVAENSLELREYKRTRRSHGSVYR